MAQQGMTAPGAALGLPLILPQRGRVLPFQIVGLNRYDAVS